MEIKCKLSFTIPESLIEALEIDEDTPVIASVTGNRILLEIVDEDTYEDDIDDCDDYEEYECNCNCGECEYFCPHCGECILDCGGDFIE